MLIKSEKSSSNFQVYLAKLGSDLEELDLNDSEKDFLYEQIENEQFIIHLNRYPKQIIIYIFKSKEKDYWWDLEEYRKASKTINSKLNSLKAENVDVLTIESSKQEYESFVEALALSNYQFLKYFSDSDKKENSLKEIRIISDLIDENDLLNLNSKIEGVYFAKDLINEPQSTLNAPEMANRFKEKAEKLGIQCKVLDKEKIVNEKMGGLLAVNMGSLTEPRFTVLEYKSENAVNDRPFVMVGKGVVYDTGGLSLKPTADSMDFMKTDMGGAAIVSAATFAIAQAKLPIHLITLIPSTDNRPGFNAYAPGDVIKMYSGQTVEVLNTDAEGRMILADALHWAKRYNPEFVIDAATLTGLASLTFSSNALVAMGNVNPDIIQELQQIGYDLFERVAELPFWDDYAELLKSDIADMKNIGGREAGSITAGKFLEKFTDYPYLHLDIAGPTWSKKDDSYRGKGPSGFGVRLLFEFFRSKSIR